jgi:hypothetical protein
MKTIGLLSGIAKLYRRSATIPTVSRHKVPAELERIAADLIDKDSGLFEELAKSVEHYTIGFVLIPGSRSDSPRPCGTATLVIVDDQHYFLTAAHVWKELQKVEAIGITLVPNMDHCFAIPTQHLTATGPPKPAAEKDGPDIVLLKIPTAKLGEIKARKSFYSLRPVVKKPQVDVVAIEVLILLGAPGEAAALKTPVNLDMTIQAIMANPKAKKFTKGPYDYIDSKEIFGAYGFPTSYGGFSGGGLWHVYVYLDSKTGERAERSRLAGMAFYEFPAKRKYRVIRCHGARSIDVIKRMLRAKKSAKSQRVILS